MAFLSEEKTRRPPFTLGGLRGGGGRKLPSGTALAAAPWMKAADPEIMAVLYGLHMVLSGDSSDAGYVGGPSCPGLIDVDRHVSWRSMGLPLYNV